MQIFTKQRELVHHGSCDASAAVSIGPDRFLVADDENNVLRLYESGKSGGPTHTVDISAYFTNNPGKKEADIEGASELEGVVYWITSHGADKEGKLRPERRQLFATRIVNRNEAVEVQLVGKSFTGLLDAVANEKALNEYDLWKAAKTPPKEEGALCIEGLAATPENSLLIGFRNPVPRGKALLLPLRNPLQVVDGYAEPDFGKPIELDLDGLSIRDIEYWRSTGKYVILAGAFNEEPRFGVYLWSGKHDSKPDKINEINLGTLNPEAIVVYQDTNRLQIISDDGAWMIGDKKCKDLDPGDHAFRSILLE